MCLPGVYPCLKINKKDNYMAVDSWFKLVRPKETQNHLKRGYYNMNRKSASVSRAEQDFGLLTLHVENAKSTRNVIRIHNYILVIYKINEGILLRVECHEDLIEWVSGVSSSFIRGGGGGGGGGPYCCVRFWKSLW